MVSLAQRPKTATTTIADRIAAEPDPARRRTLEDLQRRIDYTALHLRHMLDARAELLTPPSSADRPAAGPADPYFEPEHGAILDAIVAQVSPGDPLEVEDQRTEAQIELLVHRRRQIRDLERLRRLSPAEREREELLLTEPGRDFEPR